MYDKNHIEKFNEYFFVFQKFFNFYCDYYLKQNENIECTILNYNIVFEKIFDFQFNDKIKLNNLAKDFCIKNILINKTFFHGIFNIISTIEKLIEKDKIKKEIEKDKKIKEEDEKKYFNDEDENNYNFNFYNFDLKKIKKHNKIFIREFKKRKYIIKFNYDEKNLEEKNNLNDLIYFNDYSIVVNDQNIFIFFNFVLNKFNNEKIVKIKNDNFNEINKEFVLIKKKENNFDKINNIKINEIFDFSKVSVLSKKKFNIKNLSKNGNIIQHIVNKIEKEEEKKEEKNEENKNDNDNNNDNNDEKYNYLFDEEKIINKIGDKLNNFYKEN